MGIMDILTQLIFPLLGAGIQQGQADEANTQNRDRQAQAEGAITDFGQSQGEYLNRLWPALTFALSDLGGFNAEQGQARADALLSTGVMPDQQNPLAAFDFNELARTMHIPMPNDRGGFSYGKTPIEGETFEQQQLLRQAGGDQGWLDYQQYLFGISQKPESQRSQAEQRDWEIASELGARQAYYGADGQSGSPAASVPEWMQGYAGRAESIYNDLLGRTGALEDLVGGQNADLLANFRSGSGDILDAFAADKAGTLGIFETIVNDILPQMGSQARRDISQSASDAAGSLAQQASQTGLYGTSALDSSLAGVNRNTQDALGRLNESLANQRLGVEKGRITTKGMLDTYGTDLAKALLQGETGLEQSLNNMLAAITADNIGLETGTQAGLSQDFLSALERVGAGASGMEVGTGNDALNLVQSGAMTNLNTGQDLFNTALSNFQNFSIEGPPPPNWGDVFTQIGGNMQQTMQYNDYMDSLNRPWYQDVLGGFGQTAANAAALPIGYGVGSSLMGGADSLLGGLGSLSFGGGTTTTSGGAAGGFRSYGWMG